jgi:tetratricopeptide (TPR) repeat protein
LEKTEEYLIKAGDEAMKTAASAEAIHYYEKVLKAISYNGSAQNETKKVADIEEKLAYAYYAQGQNIKAAEIFNTVLKSYNLTAKPANRFFTFIKVLTGMIRLGLRIKSWNGKINHEVDPGSNKLMKMLMFRSEAIATYAPKDAFIHALYSVNRVPFRYLVETEYGAGSILEISSVFPWSGRAISFGEFIYRFAWKVMSKDIKQVWLVGKYVGVMFEYFSGQLSPISDDEKAFRLGMETGQVWAPTLYHSFKSISLIEMGMKEQSEKVINNMKILVTTLENSLSLVQYFRAKQTYLLKFRRLDEVIENSLEFIDYCVKTDHKTLLLLNYCLASMAFCLKNEVNQARIYYQKAEELHKTLWLNYYISITLLTKAFIELSELKSSSTYRSVDLLNKFSQTTIALVSATKKVNCTKTEAYRFRALSCQLAGKPLKALRYYKKSIDFAIWYGAKLELSRTYFELGKFLLNPETKKKKLNGLTGNDYLEKARQLFIEMDLTYDLAELEDFINK